MRSIKTFFGSVLLTISCMGQTNSIEVKKDYIIPPLQEVGEGALISREFVYSLENRPTAQAHASTIVETPTGLVTAFFAGPHEKHPDVGIRVSHLQDGEWSWPLEVANGFVNDTLRYPTWNPVFFYPKRDSYYFSTKKDPIPWIGGEC